MSFFAKIRNGPAGDAVNIQDGGNTLTVDGTVTVQDGGGALTVDGTVAVTDGGGSITVDDGGTPLDVVLASGGAVGIADGPNLDAFSRLRVSQPEFSFDAQLTYDLQPLVFEQLTNGSGAAVAHDATNRCATFTLAASPPGAFAGMQSYEFIRYQPGRSQAAFVTFAFGTLVADVLKYAGLGTTSNGIRFEANGTTLRFALYSDTGHGDEFVNQNTWNLDRLNGLGGATNPSGIALNGALMQILVIDFQALYAGRVRIGFDIGGHVIYAHEFLHANLDAVPYIQDANLPVTCGMIYSGGTTASTTMQFICSSVISEGGTPDIGGYNFAVEGTGTAGNNVAAHVLSLRPNTTYNSIANRQKFVLDSVDLVVTGNNSVKFDLVLSQAISGTTTFIDVNATYSSMEYNTLGTISGSAAIVVGSWYVASAANTKGQFSSRLSNRYPITLNAAGVVRSLGTLSIIATGIGATSACRATMNWREIR